MENLDENEMRLYYQVDYTLTEIPQEAAYFHAQFRRTNPLPEKEVYTIVDGIKGQGHFVGCYLLWQTNNNGWWGEGEIKFYMDGDKEFPTICGTGNVAGELVSAAWAAKEHANTMPNGRREGYE